MPSFFSKRFKYLANVWADADAAVADPEDLEPEDRKAIAKELIMNVELRLICPTRLIGEVMESSLVLLARTKLCLSSYHHRDLCLKVWATFGLLLAMETVDEPTYLEEASPLPIFKHIYASSPFDFIYILYLFYYKCHGA